jgi:fructose-bisphosphate aldolase class II
MPLSATSDLVTTATAAGTAVMAFNVITIEHAEGVAEGAERAGAGAVIQLSENTVLFHGGRIAPLLAAAAEIAKCSSAALAIHLDHFQDVDLVTDAIATAGRFGATSIMVDAAHLPYADNVERTRSFTRAAHAAGQIGGKGGGNVTAHASGARTDPDEAAAFAEATEVDALAVAVGSKHAMTTRDAELDHDLIRTLAAVVAVPLVLHGSSGVPEDQLRRAVDGGIRKVNVGTALNVSYTFGVRNALSANHSVTDPRKYLVAGRQAIGDTVADLCRLVATPAPHRVDVGGAR